MLYRCYNNDCPHTCEPCELSCSEMDLLIGKSTPCPAGENNYFEYIDENKEFFCLVVGSRSYNNYIEFSKHMDYLLKNKTNDSIIIVSGGANGADTLAERYAKDRHYRFVKFPADWDTYGKSAGYIRNEKMHKYISTKLSRGVVAFWDGVSKGTAHSFELAEKYNNPIRIVKVSLEK